MSELTNTAPTLSETVSAVTPLDVEEFTPYSVHTVLNKVLEIVGVDKVVRPQMMYNYDRNGLINGTKSAKRYSRDETMAFIEKFVGKRI